MGYKRIIIALLGILSIAVVSFMSFSPASGSTRVATWIGARGGITNNLSYWVDANKTIGPLQTDRVFYRTLPTSYWDDNYCSGLPASVMCIVSYKTPTTNVASYVSSVPKTRPFQITFNHEPEGGDFSSGASFVSQFEQQVDIIRAAANASGRTNVKPVMIAGSSYQYAKPERNGYNCSYIPPAKYVSHYYADIYDYDVVGLQNLPGFQRWLQCTSGLHRTRGITEMGIAPTFCSISGLTRTQVLRRNVNYLPTVMPKMFMLEYWWVDTRVTDGTCGDWKFTDSTTINLWKNILAGTV